jgi:uncharacterized protein YndB with AHSA1/START domain
MNDFVARARMTINAPVGHVWQGLTDPKLIKQYMFGTNVDTTWEPGSPIVYRGEWQGTQYADTGKVLEFEPHRLIRSTFFSSLSGKEDRPENYNTVTYELEDRGAETIVTVTQDNNATQDEADEAESNWRMTLEGLREVVEELAGKP